MPSGGARPARCGGSLRRLGTKAISVRHDDASSPPLLDRLARVPPWSHGPGGAEPVTGMAPEHARRSASPAPEREALAGLVERVTYHNPANGFCVLRVKVRGQRELVTVVGAAAAISAGELVQASGTWINDRTHGLPFKAAGIRDSKGVDLLPHP